MKYDGAFKIFNVRIKTLQIPLRRVQRFSRLASLVLHGFSLAVPFGIQKKRVKKEHLLTFEIHSRDDGTCKQRDAWEYRQHTLASLLRNFFNVYFFFLPIYNIR
jgi:hypothetical protein